MLNINNTVKTGNVSSRKKRAGSVAGDKNVAPVEQVDKTEAVDEENSNNQQSQLDTKERGSSSEAENSQASLYDKKGKKSNLNKLDLKA